MLGVVYFLVFLVLTWLLIQCFRTRSGWGRLLALDILATVGACVLVWYFDTLPGYGIMPGWAYFSEVMYSLAAAVAFGAKTLVSLLGFLLWKKK